MRVILSLLLCAASCFASINLRIGGKEASLDEAVLEARLDGRFLIRNLKLTFHNEGSRVTEGDLTCPLDEGEEIVSFAMDVNGIRREGVVVPAKKGRHAYETIVARGVDPGLIEVDEVANEFRTRVFPIPAKGDKTVWITTARIIDEGRVEIWPRGLGRPKKWRLEVSVSGGKAGEFEDEQAGTSATTPGSGIEWVPKKGVAYRSGKGDVHFAVGKERKYEAEVLEVWLDGSAELVPQVKDRLMEVLELYQNSKVVFRVFRKEVSPPREFLLEEGKAPGLLAAIYATPHHGMARPERLLWKTTTADAIILVSDGAFATGREGVGETPCPLHVIDSGNLTSAWLRHLALRSGGGWHSPARLDPRLGIIEPGALVFGEVMDHILYVKPSEEVIETPIANWLWARLTSQEMNDRGVSRKEIDEFNYHHGVMDASSSMIVMETAAQYQEFGIEPPAEDPKLYREWEALQVKEREKAARNLDGLADLWSKRCERLSAPVPPLSERILEQVENRKDQLDGIVKRNKDVKLATVHPLMTELFAIEALVEDGIDDEEIGKIKRHLDEVSRIENELKLRAPWLEVTVGGQVRQPGRIMIPSGGTLADAVKAAGGETPFGAINRVKLYRNGKVYTYNLREAKHRGVRMYSGDLLDVPQKMWLGNGGGGGRKTAPFSKEAPVKIAFEKGDSQPPKYYLSALSKVMNDDEKWPVHYGAFRAACGWKADFYLNVISLLEDAGQRKKALDVAGELAEHMPDHPEVLRKAARAFRRLGDLETSHVLFARIQKMNPDDALALYDLARVKQRLGEVGEAVDLYWKAARVAESQYTKGRAIVILEEMNALLAKENLKAADFGIDDRFVKHIPVQLRAVLEWDADQSNLDLIIRQPTGAWMTGVSLQEPNPNSWWSGNVTRGNGPEGWCLQGLVPGTYHFGARFYGDWNDDGLSTATAEVEFTRNFGTPEETREVHALRVEEKTQVEVVKAKVYPEGWE